MGCVAGAHAKGALKIIALDANNDKLELAKQMGASHCFNISRGDAHRNVMEVTRYEGCDVYIEAVSYSPATKSSLIIS